MPNHISPWPAALNRDYHYCLDCGRRGNEQPVGRAARRQPAHVHCGVQEGGLMLPAA